MRVLAVTFALLIVLAAGAAGAAKNDIMPAPAKAPRVPVQQLTLYDATDKYLPPPSPSAVKPALPKASVKESAGKEAGDLKDAREFEGAAKAIDGERLLIGGKEIRLFGIVTPGIHSNYGSQARQHLDAIIKGAVLCKVTDKDSQGHPIAFCGTVNTPDLSYEMLRQGWAMVDRKTLKNNSLAEVYEKVEQQAQSQNKGLFAPMPMVNSIPLSNPANTVTVPLVPVTQASSAKAEEPKTDADMPQTAKQDVVTTDIPGTALSIVQSSASKSVKSLTLAPAVVGKGEAGKAEMTRQPPPHQEEERATVTQNRGFFERYQAIVAGILWVFGAFAFGVAIVARDRLQEIEKRKALAAALHGELTSARHICRTRARDLTRRRHMGMEDAALRPSQLWPRLRAVVYQAHVGSIGLLGSDLARRVAAIYGQCADYAAYYQQAAMQHLPSGSAVSETLSNLANYMDDILDGLAQVEQTGKAYVADMIDDGVVNDADYHEANEQQARHSMNEEARIIKERFERMAMSMVDMLGRKRECPNSMVAVAGDTAISEQSSSSGHSPSRAA